MRIGGGFNQFNEHVRLLEGEVGETIDPEGGIFEEGGLGDGFYRLGELEVGVDEFVGDEGLVLAKYEGNVPEFEGGDGVGFFLFYLFGQFDEVIGGFGVMLEFGDYVGELLGEAGGSGGSIKKAEGVFVLLDYSLDDHLASKL